MNRFPVITTAVVLLAAIVALAPEVASALVYDRDRILSGEVWRIVTCNWVHFSRSHLVYDLLAFGVAGALIELRGYRRFGVFCVLAPLMVGFTVLLLQPNLATFGGLSGVATGAIVFLSLHGLRERGAWLWVCVAALTAIAAKTAFEFMTGEMAFARSEDVIIKAVPASHVAGALAALLIYCTPSYFTNRKNRLPEESVNVIVF